MSSLMAAVNPPVGPQSGVKRPLSGPPTGLGRNQPAFRGVNVSPGGAIKTPKLSQGNKPNQQTNVPIVYNRVAPLEHLSSASGRMSPGDVIFIHKYPPGFHRLGRDRMNYDAYGALSTYHAANGTQTVSRIYGLDGVNRLLHPAGPDG